MRPVVFAALATLGSCLSVEASAAQMAGKDYSGTYLCVEEISGGLSYEAPVKKWDSTRFTTSRKFVLKAAFLESVKDTSLDNFFWDQYSLKISDFGDQSGPIACAPLGEIQGSVTSYDGLFNCQASLMIYRISLAHGRFLQAYLQGYIDGLDNNDNTPSVSGGSCAKVD